MTLVDLAVQAGLLAASGFVGGASALLLRRPRTRPVTPQVPKRTGGAGTAPTRTQPPAATLVIAKREDIAGPPRTSWLAATVTQELRRAELGQMVERRRAS